MSCTYGTHIVDCATPPGLSHLVVSCAFGALGEARGMAMYVEAPHEAFLFAAKPNW